MRKHAVGLLALALLGASARAHVVLAPARLAAPPFRTVPAGRARALGPRARHGGGGGGARMVGAELTFVERMIAGSIARTVAQTLLHPLDTLRTRAQAKKRGDLPGASAGGGVPPAEPLARTLCRGLLPQVLLAGPAGALQFATLEYARGLLTGAVPSPAAVNLLAAACGALAASIVRVPQENVKQPVQVQEHARSSRRAGGGGGERRADARR